MSDALTDRAAREWRAEHEAAKHARPSNSSRPDDFEHFEQFEQRETADNLWPKPDLRIVEDGRAPSPTLDDDALPAGWEE
jgi:hypothetical protein